MRCMLFNADRRCEYFMHDTYPDLHLKNTTEERILVSCEIMGVIDNKVG
jgi:hypothetical protein